MLAACNRLLLAANYTAYRKHPNHEKDLSNYTDGFCFLPILKDSIGSS